MGQNFPHKIRFPYRSLLLLQVFKSYPYHFTIFCLKLQVYIIEEKRAFLEMPSPHLEPQRCKKFASAIFAFFPASTCYTSLFIIPAFRSCSFPCSVFSHPFLFCLFILLLVNIRHFCSSFLPIGRLSTVSTQDLLVMLLLLYYTSHKIAK